MTEKFRKLMGIKSDDSEASQRTSSTMITEQSESDDGQKNVDQLFKDLDMQYSIARISTHMNRGVGLGFSNNRLL